jgi:hypothetical protein
MFKYVYKCIPHTHTHPYLSASRSGLTYKMNSGMRSGMMTK